MNSISSLFSLLAALPAVQGVVFAGPSPTSTSLASVAVGISLRPTIPPSLEELRKRQTDSSPEICGWVDGVYCMLFHHLVLTKQNRALTPSSTRRDMSRSIHLHAIH